MDIYCHVCTLLCLCLVPNQHLNQQGRIHFLPPNPVLFGSHQVLGNISVLPLFTRMCLVLVKEKWRARECRWRVSRPLLPVAACSRPTWRWSPRCHWSRWWRCRRPPPAPSPLSSAAPPQSCTTTQGPAVSNSQVHRWEPWRISTGFRIAEYHEGVFHLDDLNYWWENKWSPRIIWKCPHTWTISKG